MSLNEAPGGLLRTLYYLFCHESWILPPGPFLPHTDISMPILTEDQIAVQKVGDTIALALGIRRPDIARPNTTHLSNKENFAHRLFSRLNER